MFRPSRSRQQPPQGGYFPPPQGPPTQGYLPPGYGAQPGQQWQQQPPQGGFIPTGPRPPRKRSGARIGCLSVMGVVVLIIIIGAVAAALGGSQGHRDTQAAASTRRRRATYTAGETQSDDVSPPAETGWSRRCRGRERRPPGPPGWRHSSRPSARRQSGRTQYMNVEKDLCPVRDPTAVSQQQAIVAAEATERRRASQRLAWSGSSTRPPATASHTPTRCSR